MGAPTDRNRPEPDLGMLGQRLLFGVQRELFARIAELGFDDIVPRHGAVLAYLQPNGIRATDLSQVSGQHKQVVGTLIDELERLGYVERRPDPQDRRAKLIYPTERGLKQMAAADEIITSIEDRHARRLGAEQYASFKALLVDIARDRPADV